MHRGTLWATAALLLLLQACAAPQPALTDYQRGYNEGYANGYDEGYYQGRRPKHTAYYQQRVNWDGRGDLVNVVAAPGYSAPPGTVVYSQSNNAYPYFLPGDQAYYCFNRLDLALVKITEIHEAKAKIQVLDWVSKKAYWLDQVEVNDWVPLNGLSLRAQSCG